MLLLLFIGIAIAVVIALAARTPNTFLFDLIETTFSHESSAQRR
jgi:hypothetical protein